VRGFVGYGLVLSLGLVIFVAPFACPWPDGLESVARALGFEHLATPSPMPVAMADYRLPFVGSAATATALAGLLGTVAAFIAAYLLARWLVPTLGTPNKDASH
jgi:cobalt/nickel transport protein